MLIVFSIIIVVVVGGAVRELELFIAMATYERGAQYIYKMYVTFNANERRKKCLILFRCQSRLDFIFFLL